MSKTGLEISSLHGRTILDSRGSWTIEVVIGLENGFEAVASVPQGKSKGKFEAEFSPPDKAVENIKKKILPAIKGMEASRQIKIDKTMIDLDGTPDKSSLGANAILGVSMACARVAALSKGLPLWQHLRQLGSFFVPPGNQTRLFVNVINGGLHAGNNLDFQEYMVIPKTKDLKDAVNLSKEFYELLKKYLTKNFPPTALNVGDEGGFACDFRDNSEPFEVLKKLSSKSKFSGKLDLGMDAAANGVKMKNKDLLDFYKKTLKETNLYYLEDPFREEDFNSFSKLTADIGKKTIIAGDDLTVTNVSLMRKAKENNSVNGVIIKPNQIGSVTETIEAIKFARAVGWMVVVSHRSGETNDDFIADLAIGVGADGIKLGSPARGERVSKYNRLLSIREEI